MFLPRESERAREAFGRVTLWACLAPLEAKNASWAQARALGQRFLGEPQSRAIVPKQPAELHHSSSCSKGGVVLGLSTGGLALVGLAVIAGITLFVEYFLLHNTSHVVKVYNLTPYDISWSIPYQPEGAISMSPAIAAGSSSVNYIIPANHSLQVGNGSVTVYREADFSLVSSSSTHGIQYVMAFTVMDPNNSDAIIGTASVVFDMPLVGDNSLYTTVTADAAAPSPAYCESLYGQFSGTYKQVNYQCSGKLANGAQLQVTATYDLLSGTQPPPNNPGGTKEYLYNSIIVLQTT